MSEIRHCFGRSGRKSAVYLPFHLDEIVDAWSILRRTMARQVHEAFTRDEWAYLITFLDPSNLKGAFEESFGERKDAAEPDLNTVVRRRGVVGVWLPGNVSLLGPLTLILLSLTGNKLRLKGSSSAEDLSGLFLDFARKSLPDGALREYLESSVHYEAFDRRDSRNAEMAASSDVRIAFGSNEAVRSILALEHPLDSVGVSFADRQSEAWIEKHALSDSLLTELIKVFAVYGQAGCTSPRKVVILDATRGEVLEVRDRVRALWHQVIRGEPAPHIASENVMWRQCLAAQGWDAVLAPRNAAVLSAGTPTLESMAGHMVLNFVGADMLAATEALPGHIQTLGYGVENGSLNERWLELLANSSILRLVPIARMHHFGPVWDGQPFWRNTFVEVEIA